MAIIFQTPSQIADQYLIYLKGLKPEVNTDQQDSDWWIRSRVVGGVVAGAYADQRKIADDAFPQSARRDAVERHLNLYFGSGFKQATQSEGNVGVTGNTGTDYTVGTEFLYEPNGNVYQASEEVILTEEISPGVASGDVPIISVAAGQSQNLLSGAALKLTSPPAGSQSAAVTLTNISDGRDIETTEEGSQRVLDRVRFPPAGGTASDYRGWAINSDPAVVDANVVRFIYGPGTVGVVIISGTTDIDTALNNGIPVIRTPSDALISRVQDYIDARKPLTDCAFVFGPTLKVVDVTVQVRFADGDLNTIPATQLVGSDGNMQKLTQGDLVIREVQRAIYKTPPGGRQFGSSGFVVASEIEQVMDDNLSAEPYNTGSISQILVDRQCEDLSASGPNLMILASELAEPGVITVVEMT